MASSVGPQLPRKVDGKLHGMGFQQLSNNYQKLDTKVKAKLIIKLHLKDESHFTKDIPTLLNMVSIFVKIEFIIQK